MPEVLIDAVRLLRRYGKRDASRLGVRELILPRAEIPLPPGSDHPELGRQRPVGDLEANLVVALSGAAVGQRVAAVGQRRLHLRFRDQRPRERRSEQVAALVDRAGAQGGEEVVGGELCLEVDDLARDRAGAKRLFSNRLEVLLLSDVGHHRDHLAGVVIPQPGDHHRRIESARVGEGDALDRLLSLHVDLPKMPRPAPLVG